MLEISHKFSGRKMPHRNVFLFNRQSPLVNIVADLPLKKPVNSFDQLQTAVDFFFFLLDLPSRLKLNLTQKRSENRIGKQNTVNAVEK